jgi:4-hydroxythreonine-4-phosphate dehydrogenase
MGDPSGIGPEVIAAALGKRSVRSSLVPVVFGDVGCLRRFRVFSSFQTRSDQPLGRADGPTLCAVTELSPRACAPGSPSAEGGAAQLSYVNALIASAKRGEVDAICTAPVSKERISRAGVPFRGHTELLAESFGCEVLMLMDGPGVRVALATTHLPISEVPRALSSDLLASQLELLSRSLGPLLHRKPKIAVCGLNPHAGEGGLIGREEVEVIAPAIARARAAGVSCEGPLAADGLFAKVRRMPFDAVLAMYHDQGLVAAKALDFERTVNVTLGLPIPRTSPDHGVAYSLAGTGKANPLPMTCALLKAAQLAQATGGFGVGAPPRLKASKR